jgi:hypothetical protein
MPDRPPPLPPLPDDETRTLENAVPPVVPSEPATPARRREPHDALPRRRPWSAGHALIVCVLALAIALLLNAPGSHKSAYNQPDGWQRDVALAVTGPLATISHALLLDRPRKGVQALIGRSGIDEIDTEIALPEPTLPSSAPPAAAKPPRKLTFTPKRKLRVWIAGDSLVIVPGFAIVRAAGASPVIESVGGVDGRIATGLTRPDVFNWFEAIPGRVKELRPRVVVLGFGANDDKAYMTGLPEGTSIGAFGGSSWRREYARRVGGLMDRINRAGAFVVWVGLPQTRSPEQTQRFDVVNAVVQRQARMREGRAAFVDTYTTFAGDDGSYAQYLSTPTGGLVKVRADDGVHFEPEGGDMIARDVLKILNRQFDLTSWRRKGTA